MIRQRCIPPICILLPILLLAACATEFPGDPAPLDVFEYPASIALHPNGRYLYVLSTNADLLYRQTDGGALHVVDLQTGAMLPEATVRLASFAGALVLNHDASRGYIAGRGDSTITWFDLSNDGASLSCPLESGSKNLSKCRFEIAEEPTGLAYVRSYREQPLLDPLGRPILDEQGQPRVQRIDFDLLGVAHLRRSRVSFVTVLDTPGIATPVFSSTTAAVIDGPSDIIASRGETFFVTGRLASSLLACHPAIGSDGRVQGVFLDAQVNVPTPFSSYEGRALRFGPRQERLFVTNQAPNSLLVFDTSAVATQGNPGNTRLIAMMDLPRDPNRMLLVEREDAEPLLYITSFRQDVISVVDPAIPAIIGELPVGDGPYELIAGPEGSQRIYVSHFREHSIGVIDISDPAAPVWLDSIATARTSP